MKPPARNPHFRSIQVSMAFAFSVLSVVMIVILVLISYRLTEEAVTTNSKQYTRQLVVQLADTIDTYIEYMKSISSFVPSSRDVQDYLSGNADVGLEAGRELENKITGMAGEVIRNRPDISLIALFGYRGQVILSDASLELNPYTDPAAQSWYVEAQAGGGEPVISPSHVQNLIRDRYVWVISLSREISDAMSGEPIAVLLVDLNFSVINDLCSSVTLGKRGYFFIVDSKGNIVYHPQQQLIYGNLKAEAIDRVLESGDDDLVVPGADGTRLYSIRRMKSTDWRVVGVNYPEELVTNRADIRFAYTAWGLGFFGLTIVLAIILSSRISRPIKRLRRMMRQVELGNFDLRVDIQSYDEIGELGKDFNIMIMKIDELIRQNSLHQELKRRSELRALQMQINPHFLYNTLDSIIWMAEGKKEEEVITMVSSLAKLFRLSISRGQEIISIGEEVQHVTHYLTIQKMRYQDKFDFEIAVDPAVLRYRTVKIILQPLVENAIYHGIKNKSGPGRITVGGREEGGGIVLTVSDDGVGMDRETLEKMTGGPAGENSHGLGVRNVDERIKLYFGREYGLSFESREGRGTEVRIRLPVAEAGADA